MSDVQRSSGKTIHRTKRLFRNTRGLRSRTCRTERGIAIGVMMDAPVVMIENMHKHLEQTPGVDPRAAAEVGPALFFSLIIIAVSFLPVFALGGEEGKPFAPIGTVMDRRAERTRNFAVDGKKANCKLWP